MKQVDPTIFAHRRCNRRLMPSRKWTGRAMSAGIQGNWRNGWNMYPPMGAYNFQYVPEKVFWATY